MQGLGFRPSNSIKDVVSVFSSSSDARAYRAWGFKGSSAEAFKP